MKKNSESTSFRRDRKLIEEMAPQRRAEQQASEQTDELSNIAQNIADASAASELALDVIETKGTQIVDSVNNVNTTLKDLVAGAELGAEASENTTEQMRKLNDISSAISDKLTRLGDMLSEKFNGAKMDWGNSSGTGLAVVEDALPEPVEQPPLEDLLEKLLPQVVPQEDAPFLPSPYEEQNKKDDSSEGKEKDKFNLHLDDLLKTTKAGFKATVGITDRIAGMLFKYTVTAAAEAAKLAGMLFAIVLGIDMVRVYFQYFMKKFEDSWKDFDEKFKIWGPLIGDLMTMAKNVSKMFDDKNWLGLAKAIFNGIQDMTMNLAELLLVGMAKLTASMMRAIPFFGDDVADKIEGGVLKGYQERTGGALDDEDQEVVARRQDKANQEEYKSRKELSDKYRNKPEALKYAVKNGSVSQETADKITNGQLTDSFQELPEKERIAILKKRNEAEAAAIRLNERASKTMNPDANDRKNAEEARKDVIARLNDPAIKNLPGNLDHKELLANIDKTLEKFNESKVSPAPTETKDDVRTAQSIETETAKKAAISKSSGTGNGTYVQQNNISKTNKTQYQVTPQSATNSPGLPYSTRVN